MAKAFLRYNFSSVAEDVIMVWYEHSNPTAEIARWVLDGTLDHEKDGGHTAVDLNPVMHQFRFYQSSNGTALETLLLTISVDCSVFNAATIEMWHYVVNRGMSGVAPAWNDPFADTIALRDERLNGKDYQITVRGLGPLRPDELTDRSDLGGGFDLATGGAWNDGDTIFATVYTTDAIGVVNVTPNAVADIVIEAANFNVGSNHYNALTIINSPGANVTATMPALNTIPNNKSFWFSTHHGSQNYLTIQFDASDTLRLNGEDKNVIYLAKNETLKFIVKNGEGYVLQYDGNESRRGSVVGDYADRSATGAYIKAHEATGVLSANDYPGLYDFVENLPAGVACALSAWNDTQTIDGEVKYVNRSRYAIDSGTGTFRVPDLRNMHSRFLKSDVSADAGRINDVPGGYQKSEVKEHSHFVADDAPVNNNNNLSASNAVSFQNETSGVGDFKYTLKGSAGDAVWGKTSKYGGTETRGENFGQIPLICL